MCRYGLPARRTDLICANHLSHIQPEAETQRMLHQP